MHAYNININNNKTDKYFKHALLIAVETDNMVIFELLANEAERHNVDIRELKCDDIYSNILWSVKSKDICMLLIEVYNFDANKRLSLNNSVNLLLHVASFGLMEVTKYLITRSENVDLDIHNRTVCDKIFYI